MSIYAIHQQEPKFIFIVNYKVMYTSLYTILPLYFPTFKFYNKSKVSGFNFYDYPTFSVVRNPFSRTVSAFNGKCRKAPKINLLQEKAQLEYSQAQLLDALRKVRNEVFEIGQPAQPYTLKDHPKERQLINANFNILCSISFEEYVNCLSLILPQANVDGHFSKQYDAFNIPNQNPFFYPSKLFRNTKIIKLENINQEWPKVWNSLNMTIELVKENSTSHNGPSFEEYYSDKTRRMIAKLYSIDFKKFGYTKHF